MDLEKPPDKKALDWLERTKQWWYRGCGRFGPGCDVSTPTYSVDFNAPDPAAYPPVTKSLALMAMLAG